MCSSDLPLPELAHEHRVMLLANMLEQHLVKMGGRFSAVKSTAGLPRLLFHVHHPEIVEEVVE